MKLEGVFLFFPCSSGTNQLIGAKDHASVQFNIGLIDENGAYTGEFKTVAFAGFLRSIGGSDQVWSLFDNLNITRPLHQALNRLMLEARILKDKSSTKELPKLETEDAPRRFK